MNSSRCKSSIKRVLAILLALFSGSAMALVEKDPADLASGNLFNLGYSQGVADLLQHR